MGKLEHKLHSPGVMILRAEGLIDGDNLEDWRDELVKFIKENQKRGACGVLVDTCEIDGYSVEAIDTLAEFLADPAEIIEGIRMRFAFVGVKPFTQRFLREVMPLEELKLIRARFFHEVSESEALAWLQAMVTSADGLPDASADGAKNDSAQERAMRAPKADSSSTKTEDKSTPKVSKPQPKGVIELLKRENTSKDGNDRGTDTKPAAKVEVKKS